MFPESTSHSEANTAAFVLRHLVGAPLIGYRRMFAGREGIALHVALRGFDGSITPSARFIFMGWDALRPLAAELLRLADAHEGGVEGLE